MPNTFLHNLDPFVSMRTSANAMSALSGPNLNAISSSLAAADAIAGREIMPFNTMYNFRDGGSNCLRTNEVTPIHLLSNTGSAIASNVETHMAIDGNGMFIVNDAEGNTGFTRVGTFDVDANRILKNHLGQTLQVVMRDANGNISSTASTVVDADFSSLSSDPTATSAMTLKQVLPGNDAVGTIEPQDTYVYDTLGNQRRLNLSWEQVANLAGASASVNHTWKLTGAMDATYGSIPAANAYNSANGVYIEFDSSGNPLNYKVDDGGGGYTATTTAPDLNIDWVGVATTNAITMNLGTTGTSTGVVSRGYEFKILDGYPSQNGHAAGQFHKLYMDEDGYGWVTFTNGQKQQQFRVPMAQINNYNGMLGVKDSVYYTTDTSGTAAYYYPREESLGGFVPKHYESSSVSQTEQYVKLVEAQKALMMQTKSFNASKNMIETIATKI